jgi:hypothetical protein
VKRAALIATGVVLVLLGLITMAAGGAAAALFGSDGSLSTTPARVSGTGVALVVEDIAIDASSIPVPDGVGTLTLSVSDPAGRTMFVGAASGESVDTYLTGAPYDVVVEVAAGSKAVTRAVPGTQQPPPPSTQSIWTQQATGSPAELTARVSTDTTLVVMNSDATPGVDADLVVTLTVARAWSAAWIAVGVGVLLVLLGILAFWRARVARRRALAAAPAPVAPVVAAPGATILPGALVPDAASAPATAPAPEVAVADLPTTAMAAVAAPVVAAVVEPDGDPAVLSPPATDDVPSAAPEEPEEAAASAEPTEAAAPVEHVVPVETPVVETPAPTLAPDAPAVDEPAPVPAVDEPVYAAAVAEIAGASAPETPTSDTAGEQDEGVEPVEPVEPDEPGAAPVDMAALFAPAPDDGDRTAEQPAVPGVDAPPSAAPSESQHPAG